MTKHELLCEIFRIVKDEIPYDLLYTAIDVDASKINSGRNKLIKEHGLRLFIKDYH